MLNGPFWTSVPGVLIQVATVLAALRGIAAFPPLRRTWDWIDRHRQEDQRARLIETLDQYLAPKLEPIQQLLPNGGSSLADRQASLERRTAEIDRSLGMLHSRLDGLYDEVVDVKRICSTAAAEVDGHLEWHRQASA